MYERSLEFYMDAAIDEAKLALGKQETPVGAVIVLNEEIVGRGHNLCEATGDPTMHAEMIALREALERAGHWGLRDASIFVTLEPCPMCAGAIVLTAIRKLVYGAFDLKMGAVGTLYNVAEDDRLNHQLEVISGVREAECSQMLSEFFRNLRQGL